MWQRLLLANKGVMVLGRGWVGHFSPHISSIFGTEAVLSLNWCLLVKNPSLLKSGYE